MGKQRKILVYLQNCHELEKLKKLLSNSPIQGEVFTFHDEAADANLALFGEPDLIITDDVTFYDVARKHVPGQRVFLFIGLSVGASYIYQRLVTGL
ncbi:hypothetical protein A2V49_04810 [candidate division WWE3 bacterium RBG_19FT_COMBO_34_6]|uniref:Uncharacterized protein n=1 Tax=candidate division WWE3 bacterium RBG_19FT_COMBO_34_6 TaxID=1802612 RepID=A0A1F4UKL4_UNCKA|nr:MAG: hypothetical protein A2V49_04810 [candidate division WWE3 bacterium RBG_19FT_COMBO_34_6]